MVRHNQKRLSRSTFLIFLRYVVGFLVPCLYSTMVGCLFSRLVQAGQCDWILQFAMTSHRISIGLWSAGRGASAWIPASTRFAGSACSLHSCLDRIGPIMAGSFCCNLKVLVAMEGDTRVGRDSILYHLFVCLGQSHQDQLVDGVASSDHS